MTKTKTYEVKKTETECTYYCDMCNKELGTTIAYDDGYVPAPKAAIEINDYLDLYIMGDTYRSKYECLCEDCKNKYYKNIVDALKSVGILSGVELENEGEN